MRFLFREAKIHNAILFFDECESLFETRDSRPNHTLGVLLTEVFYRRTWFVLDQMHVQ